VHYVAIHLIRLARDLFLGEAIQHALASALREVTAQ
jgi:hypothetical protein